MKKDVNVYNEHKNSIFKNIKRLGNKTKIRSEQLRHEKNSREWEKKLKRYEIPKWESLAVLYENFLQKKTKKAKQ